MLTADTITDEQIRELENDPATTEPVRWECQIARRDRRIKQRMNTTKARVAAARARCAEILNAREAAQ